MRITFLFYLFFPFLFFGEIIEVENFKDLEKELEFINTESLVLFDVDSTLIIPEDIILKPCAREFSKELLERTIKNPEINTKGYSLEFLKSKIKSKMKYSLVDEKSVDLIKTLQEKNIKTIAFTGAFTGKFGVIESLAFFRVHELKELGFDFNRSFQDFDELVFDKESENRPLYQNGVLFSSGFPKGEILKKFLKKINYRPKVVIFIDNKFSNLLSSQSTMADLGIEFRGLHYIKVKKMICQINQNLANFQFNYLARNGNWLSDKEAQGFLTLDKKNEP